MDASNQETVLKRRLQNFLQELQRIGTVQGFKHFSCYLRGREEVVVTINNSLQGSTFHHSAPSSRKQSLCHSDSFTSSHLPYDKGSLVLSHNTQVGLSGMQEKGVGLPPASPSEEEGSTNETSTLFLIAGYARYSCPYVWVRSNHERLFKLSGRADSDKDSPLKLKSTAKWKDADVHVIDVISELVRLCTYPAPRNPFEVDLEYFHNLPQQEQLLTSSAMVAYLQKVVIGTYDSKPYAGKVFEDLHHIAKLHFGYLQTLAKSNNLPILKKLQQQHQSQQKQPQSRPINSQRAGHYPQVGPPPSVALATGSAPMSVCPTRPVNASSYVYGQGAKGAFPGGFERMPAPSMF